MRRSEMLALTGGAIAASALPASAQSAATIRLGTVGVEEAAMVYYAQEKGFFKQAGLDMNFSMFPNGGSVSQALLAGALDVGVTNSGSLSSAFSRGLPMVLIQCGAIYTPASPIAYLAVGPNTGIKSVKDLAGKTVAVSTLRDMVQGATMAYIDANGGDSKAVNFVEIPTIAQAPAIAQGRIHGGVIVEPIFTQNKANLVAIGCVYEAVNKKGPFQTLGVVGNKNWVDNNGALARRVSFAVRAAARWANRHHAECAPLLAQYTKISIDVINAYPRIAFAESNNSTLLQPVVDMLTRFGFLPRGFDAAGVFAPGVV
ncbi:MAG TPA: ABC transporter substrate-binding protein [Candidatus Binatia bacterium]|nr:ABC transporter substrate-binding protein [Candidatus Binatia bacterium]